MTASRDLLLVLGTVQRVMELERAARARGLDVDVAPAPRAVSSECGVVLMAPSSAAAALAELVAESGAPPRQVYMRSGQLWLPTTLEAGRRGDVRLTAATAYGGCGAKLAKGELASILCGLPQAISDDLIVGIETADDAGVVRITPELALIHTTDFFPPMVDDPFSFGRIAAANALSDVYAMGGRPLAGMNLVSFPLAQHDREVLKEILRGGLSALTEAGAVLAGGHTVEGQELLYGLAVTGTVHPERVWRNRGAVPGDVLMLTKPLGTGTLTTAAKAELAAPDALSTAIRWMATLNREAAEAAADAGPHAVTDITGFGLVGHTAELAEASSVAVTIRLGRLPLLPGAYDAAAQGLVPAGTGKNRASTASVLEVPAGADPVLVDLALDPQTSGGLLVACTAADSLRLLRRLPAATVVGVVEEGSPGKVRLEP